MTFDLSCRCGRAMRGERQARHQVLPCPGCGRGVFVLPRSRVGETEPVAPPRRWWLAPLVAALLSVAVLLAAFVMVLPYLGREPEPIEKSAIGDPKSRIDEARRLVAQGKFRLARRTLDVVIRGRGESKLSAEESRDLNQLHRQADLMARLLPVPIEDVVRRAKLVRDPNEWAEEFDAFRGQSVLFDDTVRRDERSRPVLGNHVLRAGDESIRLALEDLELLRDLPLDDGPRLIFGGRLDACQREEGGGWVIRFEPDSGVLVSDVDIATAGIAEPDEAMKQVIRRQKRWLDERGVARPARR